MSDYYTGLGVRILLKEQLTENADIGLYDDGSVSAFRWIDAEINTASTHTANTSLGTFRTDMLLRNGITSIDEDVDLTYGGNIAKLSGVTLSIQNAERFWYTLSQLTYADGNTVTMQGLQCIIYDIVQVPGGSVTNEAIYFGEVNLDSWNETTFKIPVQPLGHKRNAFMGTKINSDNYPNASKDITGKIVPLTYGKFDDGRYAKAIRTADKEEIYVTLGPYSTVGTPSEYITIINPNLEDESYFPVSGDDGNTPPIMYKIKIGEVGEVKWYDMDGTYYNILGGQLDVSTWFAGKYIKVIEGSGEDEYRQIASAEVDFDDDDGSTIRVTLSDYFKETLLGNSTATSEDQSWVKFVNIYQDYTLDTWKCKSFLDDNGTEISQGFSLYSYDQDSKAKVTSVNTVANVETSKYQYLRLPQYAYKESGSGDNNLLDLNVSLFDGSVDNMNSFLILPVKTVYLIDDSTAEYRTNWGVSGATKNDTGFYCAGSATTHLSLIAGDLQNLLNNSYSSGVEYQVSGGGIDSTTVAEIAIGFVLPDYPLNYKADGVYLGFRAITDNTTSPSPGVELFATWRRWIGIPVEGLGGPSLDSGNDPARFENILNKYFDPNPDNSNLYFYPSQEGGLSSGEYVVSGYESYELNGFEEKEKYNSVEKFNLRFRKTYSNLLTYTINFYSLTIMFRKSVSIKDAIYTPFSARIFDDTWGTRKTADGVMENPIDIFEHVCRLQNYSELTTGAGTPGLTYSSGALVNTSSSEFGGLDHPDLASAKNMGLTFQLLSEQEAWTNTFKKKLCQLAWCVNFTNESGEESLANIIETTETITDILTLANVPDDQKIGNVKEPDVKQIFTQPFIRYKYDVGSESFLGYLGVTDVDKSTYDSSYTPGIPAGTGEVIWNICRSNFVKYGCIGQPPTSLTDQPWIKTQTDAINHLYNWVFWMTVKRLKGFPVHYYTTAGGVGTNVRTWHTGKHTYINLPHQTNGVNIESVVESISKDKNSGLIKLNLILFSEGGPSTFGIQDTYNTEAESGDTYGDAQDTYNTVAESGLTDEDVQDIT